MKYFLDTEFLEGKQDKRFLGIKYGETKLTIDLISIGIVSEDSREYYAISKDFNLKEAWNRYDLKKEYPDDTEWGSYSRKVYWIRENVLKPIFDELYKKESIREKGVWEYGLYGSMIKNEFNYPNFKYLINKYGKSNKQIAEEIKAFTRKVKVENNNLVQDTPQFYGYYADYDWVAFCWLFGKMIDLPNGFSMYCRDLKQILDEKEMARQDGTDMTELRNLPTYPKQENEHNALDDARWNKKLYEFLNKI